MEFGEFYIEMILSQIQCWLARLEAIITWSWSNYNLNILLWASTALREERKRKGVRLGCLVF